MLSVRCLSVCDVRALWPNGWTDQDETWRAGRPGPWPHCVRWGRSSPPPKGHSPQFRPISVAAKWLLGSRCHLYGARPRPRRLCVRWRTRSTLHKKGQNPFPNFRPISIVIKRLHAARCHLVWRLASAQGALCYMGTQPP